MNGRAGTRAQGQGTRNRGRGVSRFKWRKGLSWSGMWAGRRIFGPRYDDSPTVAAATSPAMWRPCGEIPATYV